MLSIELEIQLVAVIVAVACAVPGVFLVLRRMALMTDAISHTVLLGIVLGFFLVRDITSPLLVLGAAGTGLLTVVLVEAVRRTRLVREDTSIGLVFPALFSIAVLLIARFASHVHLDTDAVLLGEIAFAPFRRLELAGVDLGPRTIYVMGGILLLELAAIGAFYKELKLATFDPGLAAALGFAPVALHYGFMGLVSVAAVGAFDAVGSVLVVALMIAPPAAAYLLSDRLRTVLLLAALIAALSAVAGFWLAWVIEASIAGCMAAMAGLSFLLALLFAPDRGVVAQALRRRRQRWEFAQLMLAMHLLHHEHSASAVTECREAHLGEHLRWPPDYARRVVRGALGEGWIERRADGLLGVTPAGRAAAAELAAT